MAHRSNSHKHELPKAVGDLIVTPGKAARLHKRDPGDTPGEKDVSRADKAQDDNVARIAELQRVLWADNTRSVLVVLQGMDTSGKDGTVRHLLTGVNPMGCRVVSFGAPSKEELDHDYLWRVHNAMPPLGTIGVFNRSHYEDVLVVRVRKLKPKDVIKRRFEQINRFEETAVENGCVLLKFMLHISKDEQRERLMDRVNDPEKHWKMNLADLSERQRWDEYMEAYEDALTRCSTKHAPWFVIPSDKKWYRNFAISHIVRAKMETLDLKYPKADFDPKKVRIV